jgi:Uma2 family endonuclease
MLANLLDRKSRSRIPVELENGARLTQLEFHRLYEESPEEFRAELIDGIVYLASRRTVSHGEMHIAFDMLFGIYASQTLGCEGCSNTTVLLGPLDEPQPDVLLIIDAECGGQTDTTADDYIKGAPDLIAEIAVSKMSIDFHGKRKSYAAAGVKEYLVLNLQDKQLHWFDLVTNKELQPNSDCVYRIRNFPGLWIDGAALIAGDLKQLLSVLQQGLASPEHTAFVVKLAAARAEHEVADGKS